MVGLAGESEEAVEESVAARFVREVLVERAEKTRLSPQTLGGPQSCCQAWAVCTLAAAE